MLREPQYHPHPQSHFQPLELTHREYELTVRQEPKQARMCGVGGKADRRPIDPPPIVQLRVIDPAARNPDRSSSPSGSRRRRNSSSNGSGESRDDDRPGSPPYDSYAQSYLQNPYYFMFASLAKPDDDAELHWLKDGRTRCTTGSVVSSLYHLKDPQHNNEDAGFFVFPDLSVRTEGSYRLKLSLFEVVGNNVRHCKSIYSAPFYVYTAKKFPGMEESTPLSCSLADQGIKIRIRKDIRVRKRPNQALESPLTLPVPPSQSQHQASSSNAHTATSSSHPYSHSHHQNQYAAYPQRVVESDDEMDDGGDRDESRKDGSHVRSKSKSGKSSTRNQADDDRGGRNEDRDDDDDDRNRDDDEDDAYEDDGRRADKGRGRGSSRERVDDRDRSRDKDKRSKTSNTDSTKRSSGRESKRARTDDGAMSTMSMDATNGASEPGNNTNGNGVMGVGVPLTNAPGVVGVPQQHPWPPVAPLDSSMTPSIPPPPSSSAPSTAQAVGTTGTGMGVSMGGTGTPGAPPVPPSAPSSATGGIVIPPPPGAQILQADGTTAGVVGMNPMNGVTPYGHHPHPYDQQMQYQMQPPQQYQQPYAPPHQQAPPPPHPSVVHPGVHPHSAPPPSTHVHPHPHVQYAPPQPPPMNPYQTQPWGAPPPLPPPNMQPLPPPQQGMYDPYAHYHHQPPISQHPHYAQPISHMQPRLSYDYSAQPGMYAPPPPTHMHASMPPPPHHLNAPPPHPSVVPPPPPPPHAYSGYYDQTQHSQQMYGVPGTSTPPANGPGAPDVNGNNAGNGGAGAGNGPGSGPASSPAVGSVMQQQQQSSTANTGGGVYPDYASVPAGPNHPNASYPAPATQGRPLTPRPTGAYPQQHMVPPHQQHPHEVPQASTTPTYYGAAPPPPSTHPHAALPPPPIAGHHPHQQPRPYVQTPMYAPPPPYAAYSHAPPPAHDPWAASNAYPGGAAGAGWDMYNSAQAQQQQQLHQSAMGVGGPHPQPQPQPHMGSPGGRIQLAPLRGGEAGAGGPSSSPALPLVSAAPALSSPVHGATSSAYTTIELRSSSRDSYVPSTSSTAPLPASHSYGPPPAPSSSGHYGHNVSSARDERRDSFDAGRERAGRLSVDGRERHGERDARDVGRDAREREREKERGERGKKNPLSIGSIISDE